MGMAARAGPFFFFNDTATTEIYTLSLHDALPISTPAAISFPALEKAPHPFYRSALSFRAGTHSMCNPARSEEHTSELQSQSNLVCRLLLEKKKFAPRCAPADLTPRRLLRDVRWLA